MSLVRFSIKRVYPYRFDEKDCSNGEKSHERLESHFKTELP